MVDVGTLADESFCKLEVYLLGQQHVHQDRHAVPVFLIDVRGVLQHELVQTVIVAIFSSEHDWCKPLAVFDQQVLFGFDLLADGIQDVFLLVANRQENRRSVLFAICAIVEDLGSAVEQELNAVVLFVQDGQVERTQRVVIQQVEISPAFNEKAQLAQITSLCRNVRCGIPIVVLAVHLVLRLHEHLQDVITVFESGCQVQRVVPFLVCIIYVDAMLGKNAHDVSVSATGRDPERIQSLLVLLVNFNHLVLQH